MHGSGGFIHQAALSSGEEWGYRLAAVPTPWEVTSPCPLSLSFTDTTRPRKSHEKEGVEYHFVSKQAFEADLHHNKYVGLTASGHAVHCGWVPGSLVPPDLPGGLSERVGDEGMGSWWKAHPSFQANLGRLRN